MTKASNDHDLPFGEKNIILAGDFAQLPPVAVKEASFLCSGFISTQIDVRNWMRRPENDCIGKSQESIHKDKMR